MPLAVNGFTPETKVWRLYSSALRKTNRDSEAQFSIEPKTFKVSQVALEKVDLISGCSIEQSMSVVLLLSLNQDFSKAEVVSLNSSELWNQTITYLCERYRPTSKHDFIYSAGEVASIARDVLSEFTHGLSAYNNAEVELLEALDEYQLPGGLELSSIEPKASRDLVSETDAVFSVIRFGKTITQLAGVGDFTPATFVADMYRELEGSSGEVIAVAPLVVDAGQISRDAIPESVLAGELGWVDSDALLAMYDLRRNALLVGFTDVLTPLPVKVEPTVPEAVKPSESKPKSAPVRRWKHRPPTLVEQQSFTFADYFPQPQRSRFNYADSALTHESLVAVDRALNIVWAGMRALQHGSSKALWNIIPGEPGTDYPIDPVGFENVQIVDGQVKVVFKGGFAVTIPSSDKIELTIAAAGLVNGVCNSLLEESGKPGPAAIKRLQFLDRLGLVGWVTQNEDPEVGVSARAEYMLQVFMAISGKPGLGTDKTIPELWLRVNAELPEPLPMVYILSQTSDDVFPVPIDAVPNLPSKVVKGNWVAYNPADNTYTHLGKWRPSPREVLNRAIYLMPDFGELVAEYYTTEVNKAAEDLRVAHIVGPMIEIDGLLNVGLRIEHAEFTEGLNRFVTSRLGADAWVVRIGDEAIVYRTWAQAACFYYVLDEIESVEERANHLELLIPALPADKPDLPENQIKDYILSAFSSFELISFPNDLAPKPEEEVGLYIHAGKPNDTQCLMVWLEGDIAHTVRLNYFAAKEFTSRGFPFDEASAAAIFFKAKADRGAGSIGYQDLKVNGSADKLDLMTMAQVVSTRLPKFDKRLADDSNQILVVAEGPYERYEDKSFSAGEEQPPAEIERNSGRGPRKS